ncbi:NmrA family NAD(P)-binding protein [Arsenicibacter rosenii]|uniref:NAD-dependent dehydratase n=1 Tax=Arsenicibacter rosenii TaxID=1750698 RepID=A0A1S2VRU6_9BACT|nr:NAD(P)H-binding protein [Arsenicibacter rosenii]OIN60996.1 NAD-dependent dehydratase [Arsenicibacter rosenii]
MNPSVLILGATGSIGYAVTRYLLRQHYRVTILVRNRQKAVSLFGQSAHLTVVEGDAQNAAFLQSLAKGKDFVFHGINYPYHQWFGQMDVVTQKLIDAVDPETTLVFPGNIYSFGLSQTPIREDALPNPCSRKGELRLHIEQMLEEAALAGKCRVINVRLPDFWGPNVMNDGVKPVFVNALTGKAIPWLYNADIPHQTVYTPDAAVIIGRLMALSSAGNTALSPAYSVWNYGGHTFGSMRSLFQHLTQLTGQPLRVTIYSKLFVSLMGWFIPVLREVKEMGYLYENTVLLDDSRVRTLFPDFAETPLDDALTETLGWFAREHKLPFSPGHQAATVR